MMMNGMTATAGLPDADLVVQCLAGNRDAFGRIVSRYQSLICSLAYSATGSLGQSEDLAQETFITAWKHLGHLRERHKLRAWLCGIARNRINNTLRLEGHEPLRAAEPLDAAHDAPASEPLPSDHAISKEEEAILWRSLEGVPEIYREPLVLFYREGQSVEKVAEALELSEDAVKQRLSRGRKLLHEQVVGFIEGALKRTSPGKVFTLGVLAALPALTTSAKAATIGTTAAKGCAMAKGAATLGSLGGLLAMLGGAFVSLQAQTGDAKSPRERRLVLQMIGFRIVAGVLLVAGLFGFRMLNFSHQPLARDTVFAILMFTLAIICTAIFDYSSRRQRQIQIEDGTWVEAEWTKPRKDTESSLNPTGAGSKLKTYLKAVRFQAALAVLFLLMILQSPWKRHLGDALWRLAALALILLLAFRSWQNRPRYQSLRLGGLLWIAASCAGLTLFEYNSHQSLESARVPVSNIALPHAAIVFNAVIVLAYAVFTGMFNWKRKNALSPGPAKSKL